MNSISPIKEWPGWARIEFWIEFFVISPAIILLFLKRWIVDEKPVVEIILQIKSGFSEKEKEQMMGEAVWGVMIVGILLMLFIFYEKVPSLFWGSLI